MQPRNVQWLETKKGKTKSHSKQSQFTHMQRKIIRCESMHEKINLNRPTLVSFSQCSILVDSAEHGLGFFCPKNLVFPPGKKQNKNKEKKGHRTAQKCHLLPPPPPHSILTFQLRWRNLAHQWEKEKKKGLRFQGFVITFSGVYPMAQSQCEVHCIYLSETQEAKEPRSKQKLKIKPGLRVFFAWSVHRQMHGRARPEWLAVSRTARHDRLQVRTSAAERCRSASSTVMSRLL